jgi:hypothetical protein
MAYQRESVLRSMLDEIDDFIGFCEGWVPIRNRFDKLCTFAGGIAFVYPDSTRVESDFSVIRWDKDECRTSLADLSLEGIMRTKQLKYIQTLNDA